MWQELRKDVKDDTGERPNHFTTQSNRRENQIHRFLKAERKWPWDNGMAQHPSYDRKKLTKARKNTKVYYDNQSASKAWDIISHAMSWQSGETWIKHYCFSKHKWSSLPFGAIWFTSISYQNITQSDFDSIVKAFFISAKLCWVLFLFTRTLNSAQLWI